jgi:nitric oxide reductase NorE protein
MEDSSVDEYGEDSKQSTKFGSGSEGIWTFVFIDMVVFALIFFVYTAQRIEQYQLYESSHRNLSVVFGFLYTLVLLTSSLFVVRAVQSARLGNPTSVSANLSVALGLGLAFCVSKGIEYYLKIDSGIEVTSNSFYTFYFFITFIHLLHAIAGMTFMYVFKRNGKNLFRSSQYITGLENVGVFWHFVDLLWVFIYSLLYLM